MKKKRWIFGASGLVLIAIMLLRWYPNEETRRPPNEGLKDVGPLSAATEKANQVGGTDLGEVSPQEETPVGPAVSAEDYAERRAAFQEKLEPLFGSKEKGRGILYSMVVESLNKESVPLLRDLLQDEAYKERWSAIATMIAWLSDKGDEESVRAIIAYIRRPNTWPADDRNSIISHTVKKGGVLKNLGLFESELVNETLQNAFVEEGAEELISAWINVQTTVEPRYLGDIIRSWAAKGLVLTRDPENIALVRESYEALAHKMLSAEQREGEMTAELWLDAERYLAYAGGMAHNDMLTDMGVVEFMRLRDDSHTWAMIYSQFKSKYRADRLDDDRMILQQCPICGKGAE